MIASRVARPGGVGMLLAVALLALPPSAAAQQVKVELRAGAAVGNFSETDANLDLLPRPTYAAAVELWPTETLAAYASFNRSSFGCEEGFCTDRDVSLTSQGVVIGGRWAPGLAWVRAGLAVQSLDVRATGASESSEPGLGFELGAGVEFPVGDLFRLRPGVTYLRHGASTDLGDGHAALLALEVGVAVELRSF